ncbi:hypothetical protein PO124_18065 [Bacillus licheniformis]|nr:hypothetical protein [Bacillus licheniformis]
MARSDSAQRTYAALHGRGDCCSCGFRCQFRNRTGNWLEKWRFANSRFRALLRNLEAEDLTFEGNIYRNLQHLIPDNSSVFVGNSMPIRDADTFLKIRNGPSGFCQ